ncbi:branched-chain amino acid ABC transporter permease, partial [Streptomyces sp. NPDC001215]
RTDQEDHDRAHEGALAPVHVADNLAHWAINLLIFTLMFAVMSSAWNLIGGFGGYPSLGHAAFFGIGAYTEAIWFGHHPVTTGYEPLLLLPVVGLIGAAVGLPIGAMAMRTRADVFAIVTITLLFVTQGLAFNLPGVTGGAQGLAIPPAPFSTATYDRPFYYVLLLLLALAMGVTFAVMHSKIGLGLATVRGDEDKARGIGVRVTGIKLLAFCVSVGLTTVVGAVWAYYEGFIYPQFAVDPLITIAVVLMTFLGGRATLWGPVLGAFILESAQQYLAYRLGGSQVYLIAYALVFLLIMLLLPRGILPTLQDRLRRRRGRHKADDTTRTSLARPNSTLATGTIGAGGERP